jgi:hypothetical protein
MYKQEDTPKKLSEIRKENPFRVPGNYFEDFQARIQLRIEQEMQPEMKKPAKVIELLKPALSLAASFAAVFMIVYLPISSIQKRQFASDSPSTEVQIETDDYTYLIEDMDENTFFALFNNGDSDEIPADESITEYLAANYSDYDIFMETQK